jgi:hypothetical protein
MPPRIQHGPPAASSTTSQREGRGRLPSRHSPDQRHSDDADQKDQHENGTAITVCTLSDGHQRLHRHPERRSTLVLVYAQPLARIQQLTIDDIHTAHDGRLLIRLGDPPSPIPAPFDRIVQQHIDQRANRMTATNADTRWLFPGRRAGQPLHITSMRLRLSNLGIPNLSNRSRAIRELLRQAPPIIVAGMLGYSANSAEKIATEYGSTWQRYPHTAASQPRRPPTLGH